MAAWKEPGDFSPTRSVSTGAVDQIGGVAPSPSDVCTVDIANAPMARALLAVCREGNLNDSQIERIGYRVEVIDSLTQVIAQSADDPARIQWANRTIEEKKCEIEAIVAEEVVTPHALGRGRTPSHSP